MSSEDVILFHYTNKKGWNGIQSQRTWLFRAVAPACGHPTGAYFTTWPPDDPKLATRLRVPKKKLEYLFEFLSKDELTPLEGGRGRGIVYSPEDYSVAEPQQRRCGEREALLAEEAVE